MLKLASFSIASDTMLRMLSTLLHAVFALCLSACGEAELVGPVAFPIDPDVIPGELPMMGEDGQPILPPTACDAYGAPTAVSVIRDDALDEISGIVISRQYADVAWVHNDSGDGPRVYAVQISTGALLATVTLEGASSRDWEDIALEACGDDWCLFLADTGDNLKKRDEVFVHRVVEPDPFAGDLFTSDFETMTVNYPDGANDVEAVFVYGNTVYFLSKSMGRSRVYASPFMPRTHVMTEFLHQIDWRAVPGGLLMLATGADFHPSPPRLIVRAYGKMVELRGVPGRPFRSIFEAPITSVPVHTEGQGEAVGFHDGGYYHVAEGKNPTLYHVPCAGLTQD